MLAKSKNIHQNSSDPVSNETARHAMLRHEYLLAGNLCLSAQDVKKIFILQD